MEFKELIVWQKAHALTLRTINIAKSVKRSYASDMIMKQLLRAVTSIGANIAEGHGRHTGKEYMRFLEIAYGSANEVENWLDVLNDAKLLQTEMVHGLLENNREIQKMLTVMLKKMRDRTQGTGEKSKIKRS